jgi:hypothetical protein
VADVYREEGLPNLTWQSDDYSDDIPFWTPYPGGARDEGLLILPYSVGGLSLNFQMSVRHAYRISTTTTISSSPEAVAGHQLRLSRLILSMRMSIP